MSKGPTIPDFQFTSAFQLGAFFNFPFCFLWTSDSLNCAAGSHRGKCCDRCWYISFLIQPFSGMSKSIILFIVSLFSASLYLSHISEPTLPYKFRDRECLQLTIQEARVTQVKEMARSLILLPIL